MKRQFFKVPFRLRKSQTNHDKKYAFINTLLKNKYKYFQMDRITIYFWNFVCTYITRKNTYQDNIFAIYKTSGIPKKPTD